MSDILVVSLILSLFIHLKFFKSSMFFILSVISLMRGPCFFAVYSATCFSIKSNIDRFKISDRCNVSSDLKSRLPTLIFISMTCLVTASLDTIIKFLRFCVSPLLIIILNCLFFNVSISTSL